MKKCTNCGLANEDNQIVCWSCMNNLVPEPARPSEGSVTCSDLVGSGTLHASEHCGVAVEMWQCSPMLRWKKNYLDRKERDGSIARYGELAPTLQQLWSEQFSGRTEWRDVPLVDGQEPTAEVSDVCPPLASETEKPRTGTRSLH